MKSKTTYSLKLSTVTMAILALLIPDIQAQNQTFQEGTSTKKWTIEAHYGYPNIYGQFVADQNETIVTDQTFNPTSVDKRFINPCGIRFQYRLSPILNLGGSFVYSRTRVRFNDGPQFIELQMERFRGFVRSELIYNGRANKDYELYGALCLGITQWQVQTDNNIPFVINSAQSLAPTPPIAGRLVPIGFRYFFNENIGLNTELGFGSALLSAGLSGRF